MYLYNPKGFVRGCVTVYNSGYQAGKCVLVV